AERHNLHLDEELTFRDLGVSAYKGLNVAKGKLGAFLLAIKEGVVRPGSYLLVESLDRVSRQSPYDADKTMREIVEAGITVVDLMDDEQAYSEAILRKRPELFQRMISGFARAHAESKHKSERVASAWDNKRAKGRIHPMTKMCLAWLE